MNIVRRDTIAKPNLSIIVPGPCNARCDFCFWRKGLTTGARQLYKPEVDEYLIKLGHALRYLPRQFTSISLTGGEPTMSDVLPRILELILMHRERYTRVVLTTNGHRLGSIIEAYPNLKAYIDYVNISRHRRDDWDNNKVFGATVPSSVGLSLINTKLNRRGIPAAVSCVLSAGFTTDDVFNMIDWARKHNFSSVRFRHDHATGKDLKPRGAEVGFASYTPVSEASCPVCRTTTRIISGMPTYWIDSIPEPSYNADNLVYEAIVQQNGELTADWAGNTVIEV